MTPNETAHLLLTVGGRSLWAELEGRTTNPHERRPLPLPTMFRDVRCERLLLGCCLAGGQVCAARAHMAGLRKSHFSEPRYRDLWGAIGSWPISARRVLQRLDLIATYLDAECMADEQQWAAATHDRIASPTLCLVACDVAAEGLARRVVMLARVRQHLQEAEQLLNGKAASRRGKGGTGL